MTTIAERAKIARARQAAEAELAAHRLEEEIRLKVDAAIASVNSFLSDCREIIDAEMSQDGDVSPIPIPFDVAEAIGIEEGSINVYKCAEQKWEEFKEWGEKEGLRIFISENRNPDWVITEKRYFHVELIED